MDASKTAPLRIEMGKDEMPNAEQSLEKLQRMRNLIQNDRETQNIIDGFANSIQKLQKATGGSKSLQRAILFYMQFSEQLLSSNETIASANSILELNVPQKKENLVRLNETIKYCIESFKNDMNSVKTLYMDVIKFAMTEMPETDCPSRLQDSLIRKIQYSATVATEVLDQCVKRGEDTIAAINDFNRENNVYHFGYRTVLHAILLFVAFGIVITEGFHTYETFIIIGIVLYIILENAWWGYAKHKVSVGKNGIEKQMKNMKLLEVGLKKLLNPESEKCTGTTNSAKETSEQHEI